MKTYQQPSDTQQQLVHQSQSKLKKYQDLVIGRADLRTLLFYELVSLFASWVPGALGLFLRGHLYKRLLGSVGKNVVFGANVVLRHPHKIVIGNNVVIDDSCVLDAKGQDNEGIVIGDNVFVGRNTLVYCQNGNICIGDNANIGSNCQIFSANSVSIGQDVLMGAYSYLVGGGHIAQDVTISINRQGRKALGITVGEDVWLGAHVTVLDGITIGKGVIAGAGAVVKDSVSPYAIIGGVPAKVLGDRTMKKDQMP